MNEIYERLKYVIIGRDKLPPQVRKILESYGDMKIKKIEIARVPLRKAITYVGNLITFGKPEISHSIVSPFFSLITPNPLIIMLSL